jgi:hypothetical protein
MDNLSTTTFAVPHPLRNERFTKYFPIAPNRADESISLKDRIAIAWIATVVTSLRAKNIWRRGMKVLSEEVPQC